MAVGNRHRPANIGKARDDRGRPDTVGRYIAYNAAGIIGGTAGWLVGAADDAQVVGRLPAGSTSSTLKVPITGLRVGARIRGGFVSAQIESAGNAAEITWQLRKQTAAAADPTDAQVTVMAAPFSVTADTAVGAADGAIPAIDERVLAGVTYYALVEGTTAAATDIQLLAVNLLVADEPANQ
ncbi:MAG TPA: hypothetical protein VFH61_18810 [Thermoleophilia bacterium]|nr:hypothetical protein [Thermoleophilia bacterium]